MTHHEERKATVQEVKERHELELLEIEGVEGVGISEWHQQLCIAVYTSSDERVAQQVPKEIEGVRVVIIHTGSFSAL